jgi:hypothetical protein
MCRLNSITADYKASIKTQIQHKYTKQTLNKQKENNIAGKEI